MGGVMGGAHHCQSCGHSTESFTRLTCVSISSRNKRQHEREIVELNHLVSGVV